MNRIDFSIETITQSSGVSDVFSNDFDKTWFSNFSEEEINKRIFTATPFEEELGLDDGTVKYIYNSDFFRCDEFGSYNSKYHVVFGGCSETEGVGGNIEDAWSYMLYSKISKEEKCSGFFNLAKSGWGWSRIILNALIYFKKYGYPDSYFICLPNHQRKFYYKEKLKNFRNCGLEKGGEMAIENLVFKLLRRNGYIEKLYDLPTEIIDKKLSMKQ